MRLWLQEHDVVDGHIGDYAVSEYTIFVTHNISSIYIVVFYFNELVQGTMHSVILARLNLYRHSREMDRIINEIINFAVLLVIVIVTSIAMGCQFLRECAFCYSFFSVHCLFVSILLAKVINSFDSSKKRKEGEAKSG